MQAGLATPRAAAVRQQETTLPGGATAGRHDLQLYFLMLIRFRQIMQYELRVMPCCKA